jgi:uncharacterized protein YndB with AHSA1/START domain
MSTHTLTIEQFVKAPPAQVFFAFTNAMALREWLCNVATVAPRPGGRMYLWWNGDFYSAGEYTALEPNQLVGFTWSGRGDPAPTQVIVTLTEKDGGALVTLKHTVADEKVIDSYQKEWIGSLENLVSVLETGRDLRITNRPLLGVYPGDFTPEQAKSLGVPVTEGFRLDGVIDGLGAQAAGLQKDDVVVALGGHTISNDFATFVAALQGKKAGEAVKVEFYRGPEKKTVNMELSRRPVPDVPFDAKELAHQVRSRYDESLAALEKALEGVSEAEAAHKASPQDWSVKEVLAHLIQGERAGALNLAEVVTGFERWSDDFGGNLNAAVQATAAAFPTLQAMLVELHTLANELVALIEALSPEFVARKGSYFRMAWGLLEGQTHTHTHLEQIAAAIAAARK